jgi:peroxiredoxin Q/BCP
MPRMLTLALPLLMLASAAPAPAALAEGAKAPDFRTSGARGGKPFTLHLAEQLRRGPVVLYFYPKAFTQGCTLEAHAFSEAAPDFEKLGARVVGVSADDAETLRRFSVEACRSAFPVATATPAMIDGYDVRLKPGAALSNRTSYLIAPDGRILAVHSAGDWKGHVPAMLAAVRAWREKKGGR